MTTLVGANEHGKSNLLEAIAYLEKDSIALEDKCRSRNYRSRDGGSLSSIDYYFQINASEKAKILERLLGIRGQIPAEQLDENTTKLKERIDTILADLPNNPSPQILVKIIDTAPRRFYYLFQDRSTTKFLDYNHALNAGAKEFFVAMLPRVMLFSSGSELPNSVTLAELETSKEFQGLIRLASDDIWSNRKKLFENTLDGREFRDNAKDKIQRKVRTIWSQGKQGEADLRLDFDLDESTGKLRLDFIDRSGTRDQPNQRSLGFRSFFSFYLKLYSETKQTNPQGYIFCFDEPGIHLHPSGQKDLLRELRGISKKNQVVFATHSPFMIDRHPSTSVVVVAKSNEGTKLNQKPYRNNWAPLKSSLGIVMNDTFFYADRSLLVEGTSDRIIIYSLLEKFSDELDIDINFLSIIDGDNRRETPSICRILLTEDRELVLLMDEDDGGKEIRRQISGIAKEIDKKDKLKNIFYNSFVQKSHISIEDLVPEVDFEKAIRKYLKEILGIDEIFNLADVDRSSKTLGAALTEYFATKGWVKAGSSFSKTTVADLFSKIFAESAEEISEDHPSKKLCRELRSVLNIH